MYFYFHTYINKYVNIYRLLSDSEIKFMYFFVMFSQKKLKKICNKICKEFLQRKLLFCHVIVIMI